MIAEEIPEYLSKIIEKINELDIFPTDKKANHILLNEYKPAQGILSHYDGPLFYDLISTLSLGSHTVLNFDRPHSETDLKFEVVPEHKVIVEPRSLLVLKNELYHNYMHSISEFEEDFLDDPLIRNKEKTSYSDKVLKRSTRYSLTIRHVPKTSKLKLKFMK